MEIRQLVHALDLPEAFIYTAFLPAWIQRLRVQGEWRSVAIGRIQPTDRPPSSLPPLEKVLPRLPLFLIYAKQAAVMQHHGQAVTEFPEAIEGLRRCRRSMPLHNRRFGTKPAQEQGHPPARWPLVAEADQCFGVGKQNGPGPIVRWRRYWPDRRRRHLFWLLLSGFFHLFQRRLQALLQLADPAR